MRRKITNNTGNMKQFLEEKKAKKERKFRRRKLRKFLAEFKKNRLK